MRHRRSCWNWSSFFLPLQFCISFHLWWHLLIIVEKTHKHTLSVGEIFAESDWFENNVRSSWFCCPFSETNNTVVLSPGMCVRASECECVFVVGGSWFGSHWCVCNIRNNSISFFFYFKFFWIYRRGLSTGFSVVVFFKYCHCKMLVTWPEWYSHRPYYITVHPESKQ